MRGLLLLGTDTGVGKTTVACGLLRLARRRGFRLVPFKPAETGCDDPSRPADARRLCEAADLPALLPSDICPFAFAPPVAPSLAARLAGREITPHALAAVAHQLALRGDALLAETAGGLLTPYAPSLTAVSLAELLDLDVLLVAANRLGTINHTALALAEIARRRLRSSGLVLIDVTPDAGQPDRPFNLTEIQASTGVRALGTLRHLGDGGDPDRIADALADDVSIDGLLGGALASDR